MTANCTLCAKPITVPDCLEIDALRNRKTVTALALMMVQHLASYHSKDEQAVVERSEFPPTKPNNLVTLIEAAGAFAHMGTALSFLTSDDAAFLAETERMRELLAKAVAPKEAVNSVKEA